MGFSHRIQIIGRLLVLSATIFWFALLYRQDTTTVVNLMVLILISIQLYYLFRQVDRVHQSVMGFLNSIRYEDFSHTYSESNRQGGMGELMREFNEVIKKFREVRAEKEAQHQYLKTIVQHVGIGIITFDHQGEIQIYNTAARKLLSIMQLKNIKQIQNSHKDLLETIKGLRTGGRAMVKIIKGEDEVQLAVYAIELTMRGKEFKLISLQNIQSELEEKEMEAWQNLIRVLTHEIMNSVTPISSLAALVEGDLKAILETSKDHYELPKDSLDDYYISLKTIHTRSESLIRFVSDFRNMTKVRLPNLRHVPVSELIDHVLQLLRLDIERSSIQVFIEIKPEDLILQVDREQIEQVLINLIKNAVQALGENEEEGKEKIIRIKSWKDLDQQSFISIEDNGTGIEEDALKKIFIPFFTTKKNGSGIGLSLSKQIMRQHKGSITAKSVLNVGTEFILRFGE